VRHGRPRLRDHVWLFTFYERPTQKNPQGRVFVFAGNDYRLIHTEDHLPYIGPDGCATGAAFRTSTGGG
jgi:hypothetical protein